MSLLMCLSIGGDELLRVKYDGPLYTIFSHIDRTLSPYGNVGHRKFLANRAQLHIRQIDLQQIEGRDRELHLMRHVAKTWHYYAATRSYQKSFLRPKMFEMCGKLIVRRHHFDSNRSDSLQFRPVSKMEIGQRY